MPTGVVSNRARVAEIIAAPDPDIDRAPNPGDAEKLRAEAFDLCTLAIARLIELDCAHTVTSPKLVAARMHIARGRREIRDLGTLQ